MMFGISGGDVQATFPFAGVFNNEPIPLLVAAIGWRETLCFLAPDAARTCVSDDGGHGIMQLTASFPDPGWDDPATNIGYAYDHFIGPALDYWHGLEKFQGDALVKLVAATYNAGLSAAIHGHAEGDVDKYTTNAYGSGVLAIYASLRDTGKP